MNRGVWRGRTALLTWLVVWFAAIAPARADIASAEALFREGRELLAAGKVAEACLKFAESQRQDPSPGTLLNLASCHARQGKAASAWAEFLAAKRSAQSAGRGDLAQEAQKQADLVAGQRSFLTIVVTEAVLGLQIDRGGDALDVGSFGARLPTDPGRYTVTATAPGYEPWQGEVVVEAGGDDKQLRVPALTQAPPSASPKTEEVKPGSATTPLSDDAAATRSSPKARSKLPYIVGGLGLAVTGAGLVFGGLAKSKYSSATDACPARRECSAQAIDDRDTAETFANVSNVTVGVGLAAVAGGVVLLLLQPSGRAPVGHQLRFTPELLPGSAGARLSGDF